MEIPCPSPVFVRPKQVAMGKKSKRKPSGSAPQGKPAAAAAPASDKCFDDEAVLEASGECPGTFRWSEKKAFPALPPYPSSPPVEYCRGWAPYLHSRGGSALVRTAQADPALLDCLSFPATLLQAMEKLGLVPGSALRVVVLGASRRAEERTARSTAYWDELAQRFPATEIAVHFVGPEISATGPLRPSGGRGAGAKQQLVAASAFKGTLRDFRAAHPECLTDPDSTLYVTYNGAQPHGMWLRTRVSMIARLAPHT